jgi:cyclopropane fatty-acyl-phospholipid synthase-like methyltransferase
MTEPPNPLHRPGFPRANAYDPDWVMDCQMGPNALWLLEWLTERMDLKPGMRVLDLGCGKAMTSVFLAREFGVQVWAADLWVSPDDNWQRVRAAGVADRVFPIQAEAHALPLAKEFFDAVVSIDAYQYFGTDELYLAYLTRFLRPQGQLGVVVAGLTQPIEGGVPEHLTQPQANGETFWNDECICFLTAGGVTSYASAR